MLVIPEHTEEAKTFLVKIEKNGILIPEYRYYKIVQMAQNTDIRYPGIPVLQSLLALLLKTVVAAVAEWYRHRIVAGFVTSSSPVPLKTRRVGQRCTLNLSRAETSSRWCGVVVRRGGASSGVVHVT
ncbi:uncharacterized protein TNCV_3864301 [Trichonephila clavipes]|nr:uncharacterized protein TNCV_3864301 [Trichonephila clavipes]